MSLTPKRPYTPHKGSRSEAVINLIRDYPGGIDTPTLSEEANEKNVHGLLVSAIRAGVIRVEKRKAGGRGKPSINLYFHVDNDVSDLTPCPTIEEFLTKEFVAATRQPQPAVGQNTGSPEAGDKQPPSADRAEPRPTATPVPKPKGRGMGPAAASVPAAERPTRPPRPYFAADTNGQLVIDLPRLDAPVVLDGSEHYALREFIQATPGLLWKENT